MREVHHSLPSRMSSAHLLRPARASARIPVKLVYPTLVYWLILVET